MVTGCDEYGSPRTVQVGRVLPTSPRAGVDSCAHPTVGWRYVAKLTSQPPLARSATEVGISDRGTAVIFSATG